LGVIYRIKQSDFDNKHEYFIIKNHERLSIIEKMMILIRLSSYR